MQCTWVLNLGIFLFVDAHSKAFWSRFKQQDTTSWTITAWFLPCLPLPPPHCGRCCRLVPFQLNWLSNDSSDHFPRISAPLRLNKQTFLCNVFTATAVKIYCSCGVDGLTQEMQQHHADWSQWSEVTHDAVRTYHTDRPKVPTRTQGRRFWQY